jgi:hypothetical protein
VGGGDGRVFLLDGGDVVGDSSTVRSARVF